MYAGHLTRTYPNKIRNPRNNISLCKFGQTTFPRKCVSLEREKIARLYNRKGASLGNRVQQKMKNVQYWANLVQDSLIKAYQAV